METERLQKILARAGYGSRRACEEIIEQGRVTVDGRVAKLGDGADPTAQRITVDGVPIRMPQAYTYIAVHKPRGVISTVSDPEGRRTVRDMVPVAGHLYPVGRLDADSEGLILLTDDGELTQRLTHPRYEHTRVYRVHVHGRPTADELERWQRGIVLDGHKTRFDNVKTEPGDADRDTTWLVISIHEGRKHLVRRACAALGHPVIRLIRIAMGPVQLGNLPLGNWRYLTPTEVRILQKEVKSPSDRPVALPPKTYAKDKDKPRSRSGGRSGQSGNKPARPKERRSR